MDGCGSTGVRTRFGAPQAMFKTLRRLHGHNLESQGLNNLTEAFQNLITRARFFDFGRLSKELLRRTWSHSAVDFMRYRRLLPMLLSDEHDLGAAFDDFSIGCSWAEEEAGEERRLVVSNIANRATLTQLRSFFSKFGEVQSCEWALEGNRRRTMYATMPSRTSGRHQLRACLTFKRADDAKKARSAPGNELSLYGQEMSVSDYVPRSSSGRRRAASGVCIERAAEYYVTEPLDEAPSRLSRSSSITSTGTISSQATNSVPGIFPLSDVPQRVLERILQFVSPIERLRFERVNKEWLETSAKAWAGVSHLNIRLECDAFFTDTKPISNLHLKSILRRCGPGLRNLSVFGVPNLLDEKAVRAVAQHCTQLVKLDLSGITATASSLQSLSESLPHLKELAYRDMPTVGDKSLWALISSTGHQLRHLDLRGCRLIGGRFFNLLGADLESLLIGGCTRVDNAALDELSIRCPSLRSLCLSGCYALGVEAVALLGRRLKSLRLLHLNGEFPHITTEGLQSILEIATLESLSVDCNSLVSDTFIEGLTTRLRNLRVLSLAYAGSDSSITEKSLSELAKLNCLEELCISGLAAVNSRSFTSICTGCVGLRKLSARSCIYLGGVGVESAKSLPLVEKLDLSGCILVSKLPIQVLVNHFKANRDRGSPSVVLCIGGTLCEPGQLKLGDTTSVLLDFTDYSNLLRFHSNDDHLLSDSAATNDNDEDLCLLSAHRSRLCNALDVEENTDTGLPDDSLLEWAEKEAKELGLMSFTAANEN